MKNRPMTIRFFRLSAVAALLSLAVSAQCAVDQDARAVADAEPAAPAEPIMRWWGRDKRKVYAPPEGVTPRLYARVTFAPEHPVAGQVAFSSEVRGTYFPGEYTWMIDADGLVAFAARKRGGKRRMLKPGETSQWFEITEALHYGYRDIFVAEARDSHGYKKALAGSPGMFRVEFSRDGKTPCGAVGNGGGLVATALVSLARGTVEDDVSLSAADLRLALAAGAKPPPRPKRFPVKLCNAVSARKMSPVAFTNELKVMRLFGVNDTGGGTAELLDPRHECETPLLFRQPSGDHVGSKTFGCICSPDLVRITNDFVRLCEECAGPLSRGRKLIVSIMDEPHYSISMLTNCSSKVKTCRERFGKDFCFDPSDTERLLETVAFRDKVVVDYFRAISDAARAVNSNILITANVGISLVFSGNAGTAGTSPFMLADSGAIGIGQTEDWCNVQRTRQFSSYMCDVWRAATERNGLDFVMCSILMSAPETEAKAYAEVGHGAKGLLFFNYGPHWLSGDNRNLNPALYPSLRRFCGAVAAAEDAIVGAKVAKGDAALLFSESGDRLEIVPGASRDWLERNPYGKDRMCTSLMLSHCGVRTDVLDEKAVADGALDGYKVLFAADRCIRRTAVRAIAKWMRGGGVLVKTREALTGDHLGQSLPENAFARFGKVVELDFSPWKSYVRPLGHRGSMLDDCYSHRDFDMKVLAKMDAAAREAGVVRRVWTDCPLV
ncbi:MAG: hypothetical protein K6G91_07945, partial [Kiritimatiellae bacterium]|nr:hypothetical protein [Kiritimatiellia bacterium]